MHFICFFIYSHFNILFLINDRIYDVKVYIILNLFKKKELTIFLFEINKRLHVSCNLYVVSIGNFYIIVINLSPN